ncbi:MAG: hypothetical protein JSU83_06810 [Deltaproteobacteria bacterium]|nr:MAG: hypothetical protein JSU83_06810 [Deltaproteobacteria bacterium]
MVNTSLTEETLAIAKSVVNQADAEDHKELVLLIKDLEEAKLSLFVRTAEAKPLLLGCHEAVVDLNRKIQEENGWGKNAKAAFQVFQNRVSKLRNTILVRTQKAT